MDEQTKKDFLNIMKLAVRKDVSGNRDALRKIIKINDTSDNFNSSFGKKFINRIKTILSGEETEFTCILCNKNEACNDILCESCIDRYNSRVNKQKHENMQKVEKPQQHENMKKAEKPQQQIRKNTGTGKTVKTTKTSKAKSGVRQDKKRIYRKSVLGTIMYGITSIWNKRTLKRRKENNADYQKPVSGHVFIGIFTMILFFSFLFNLYAGGIFLIVGLGIAFCSLIRKIKHFKMENLLLVVLSVIFMPLGLILLALGVVKKIGYIYENRKYIRAGLELYGSIALICATLYDIPGYRCEPGIVGYFKMIFMGEFGTRWNRSVSGAAIEMVIYIIAACSFTFGVVGEMSVFLDEMEEYCYSKGLTVRQAFMKILQSPVELLLMFAPLILFVMCKTESLESGWGLDIDNNTHTVSGYKRFRSGKWEDVRGYQRRNPDDIINNNLSYRGNNPYNGSNPIPNNRGGRK